MDDMLDGIVSKCGGVGRVIDAQLHILKNIPDVL